jgi:hypothetical protein
VEGDAANALDGSSSIGSAVFCALQRRLEGLDIA